MRGAGSASSMVHTSDGSHNLHEIHTQPGEHPTTRVRAKRGPQQLTYLSGSRLTMSANPALVRTGAAELVPAPFPGELFLLRRDGVYLELDAVRTTSGK